MIGRAIVDELFPGADPLGQAVRIAGRGFRIVGIQAQQGTAGGVSLDRYVWMPIAAFERAFGPAPSLQVFAKADATWPQTQAAEDHARISMRARRHLGPGAADTFDIITPEASRSFVTAITERLGAAGPPISLMALIAAIVVVTNTTLVSVTQRTREIGHPPGDRGVARERAGRDAGRIEGDRARRRRGAVWPRRPACCRLAAHRSASRLTLEWPTTLGSLAGAAAERACLAGWYPARRATRARRDRRR